jgi:hypothetical protein
MNDSQELVNKNGGINFQKISREDAKKWNPDRKLLSLGTHPKQLPDSETETFQAKRLCDKTLEINNVSGSSK